jgi:uncharacterized membrane protein
VPADQDTPRGPRVLSKDRMEGFSDGVIAVAITLLVFDLAVRPPGSALEQVLRIWPTYLAYITSFLTIGAAWLAHTGLTDQLARTDTVFLRLNLLFLLAVTFLPFPTHLTAAVSLHNTSSERVFATMYGLTLLSIRLLGSALDAYAQREHLYSTHQADQELHRDRRKLLPVILGYVIALIIGLFLPVVALAVYAGLAVYLVVPFREVARVLERRS